MEANVRIYRRSGHIAIPYKNNMLLWGGYMENSTDDMPTVSSYHSADEVWIYNTLTDVWTRCLTKGYIPPRSSGSCGVLFDDSLYVFGGYQSKDDMEMGNTNRLYKLDIKTLTWEQVLPEGPPPPPCDKLVGWLYKERIYFFGGFGPNTSPNNSRYTHIMDTNTINTEWHRRGWNNQLVCYNVSTNTWEWPNTHGPKPGPRAAHAADISGSVVYIFGGRTCSVRNNELHALEMETMSWSGNMKCAAENVDCDWPEGRSWHSLTFISPDTAVLYGGLNQYNVVLNDCWKMKLKDSHVSWQLVPLFYDHGEPRCWHTACFIGIYNEIFVHSGLTQPYYRNQDELKDHADTLLIIPFAPKSLLRLCLDLIIENGINYQYQDALPLTLIEIIERRLHVENNVSTTIYYHES